MTIERRVSPAEPEHKVTLEGREYRIRYDFGALSLFKRLTGINLLRGWEADKFAVDEIVAFLFAGLFRYHPDVEYEWCAQRLTLDNYEAIMEQLAPALRSAMPKPRPADEASAEGNA